MTNNLEHAIKNLEMAETLVQGAADSLEREANGMTLNDKDSRFRHKDLIDSSEKCRLEILAKIRRRHRFLISVRDGYSYGKAS